MKILRRINILFAFFIILFSYSGCAVCHYYGEINGVLLDAKDGKPIQGAAVVCVYHIEHGTVGGTVNESIDARETMTDSEGRFLLPGELISAPRLPLSGFSKLPWIYIFAPEYESVALLGEQVYSRVDEKRIPLVSDGSTYRIDARPIMSVVTTGQIIVYEFRVSHLETDKERKNNANTDFVNGPASKFPNYLKLFNTERGKYGLPEWAGWKK